MNAVSAMGLLFALLALCLGYGSLALLGVAWSLLLLCVPFAAALVFRIDRLSWGVAAVFAALFVFDIFRDALARSSTLGMFLTFLGAAAIAVVTLYSAQQAASETPV